MSYAAIISAISSVRPHGNADRLQLATCAGHQVVVGLDVLDGEVGVFFNTDGQLSPEHCVHNELYSESACQKLNITQASYGFFDQRRRVRSQTFRKEKSEGFWQRLDCLDWTGYDTTTLSVGDTFTDLNGHDVCQKYMTPATLRAMKAGQQPRKQPDAIFPKHVDTSQLRYYIDTIPADSIVWLTCKLHGTSLRFGRVIERHATTGWAQRCRQGVARWLGRPARLVTDTWTHLNGSKNVTLETTTGAGYYGTNEFRYNMTRGLELHKGEILYGEIVGWVNDTQPIMHPQPIDPKDKAVAKRYGTQMRYTYGCAPGACRLFVYRIVRLNEDGVETDLPWAQVTQRCRELGLATVPQLHPPILYSGDTAALQATVDRLMDGESTLDPRHIREGVVLRVEAPDGRIRFYKSKSFLFKVLEGIAKNDDAAVDLEEAS